VSLRRVTGPSAVLSCNVSHCPQGQVTHRPGSVSVSILNSLMRVFDTDELLHFGRIPTLHGYPVATLSTL